MDEKTGVLIAIAVGLIIAATLLFFVIPEPGNRAVIATEKLDVVLFPFRNSSSWPGAEETLASRIEASLVGAGGVNVFSRAQLDRLLIDRAEGEGIDRPTAIEIGSLTGANKLITGTVYAVDTYTRETTICVKWEDGDCVEEGPATEYKIFLAAQIEIVDTKTGLIERVIDLSEAEAKTVESEILFNGFDSMIADAAGSIADRLASGLRTAYTREIRYGLYEGIERKGPGYIGKGETSRFHAGGTVHLIVHFTRIKDGDTFDLSFYAPDGTRVKTVEDVVSKGDWRHYEFDLEGVSPGRYRVEGTLGGIEAFTEAFTVSP